jgi:two-component system, chemotaxis family, chemotaxis protein CheY
VDGHHVLVVDDDPDIRALLVSVLSDEGYEARSANNGREALAAIEEWRADAIVLDLMMPVMDGWTFVEMLRAADRQIPIVILSAATQLAQHSARLGAIDFMPKPFDIESLLPRIARMTGGAAA